MSDCSRNLVYIITELGLILTLPSATLYSVMKAPVISLASFLPPAECSVGSAGPLTPLAGATYSPLLHLTFKLVCSGTWTLPRFIHYHPFHSRARARAWRLDITTTYSFLFVFLFVSLGRFASSFCDYSTNVDTKGLKLLCNKQLGWGWI